MKLSELVDPSSEHQKIERDELGRILEGKTAQRVVVGRSKDGRRISTEIEFRPFKNSAGEIVARISTARDITEQEESKRKLTELEKRFRSIFTGSREGIVLREQRESFQGRIVEVNQAYLDMLGYSRNELEDLRLEDLVKGPEDQEIVRQAAKQLRARGYTDDCNFEFSRKDGSSVPANVRLWTIVNEDTGEKQTISIIRDMSETRQAVTQMKEAQRVAHLGSWHFDVENDKLFGSDELYKIFEFGPYPIEFKYKKFILKSFWRAVPKTRLGA